MSVGEYIQISNLNSVFRWVNVMPLHGVSRQDRDKKVVATQMTETICLHSSRCTAFAAVVRSTGVHAYDL
jgi:hypothetical protein